MWTIKFVISVGTSMLSFHVDSAFGAVATENTATRVDCLGAINAARSKVDLPAFKKPENSDNKLPIKDNDDSSPARASSGTDLGQGSETVETKPDEQANFIKSFCSSILKSNSLPVEQNHEKGTYLYASQSSAEEGCAAAVNYWRETSKNFDALPPEYSKDQKPYDDPRNISFVGLFNTGANPTIDCALISCLDLTDGDNAGNGGDSQGVATTTTTTTTTTTETTSSPTNGAELTDPTSPNQSVLDGPRPEMQVSEGLARRLLSASLSTSSLICLSSPPALEQKKAPFKEEQWAKIKSLENSSTQGNVVSLFASVAVALVHSLS